MNARWDANMTVQQMVDEGVRRAYTDKDNALRASMLADPAGKRETPSDNTPSVVHVEMVPGDEVEVIVAAKGGGSENKSKFAMLLPDDYIVDWVLAHGADDGRRLVPSRHPVAGHRRLAREGDDDRQVGHDGADRHPELKARGP